MNAFDELVYLSRSTLPSDEANAVHVVHMAEAFAGLGLRTRLRAARGEGSIVEHYGMQPHFRVCYETTLSQALWMAGRWLSSRTGPSTRRVYYGRRLPAICALGTWGLPAALELHHPPRTRKQQRALQRFISSRGFRGLVVISENLKRAMLGRYPGLAAARVLVAHDGFRAGLLRVPGSAAARTGAVRAVYSGSLHPGKGGEALTAAAHLCPQVDFTVIGGSEAQVRALRASAPPNLRCTGRLPHAEVQRRLPDFDIALAPYSARVRGAHTPEDESLADWMSPLKIFEYVAAGLPIITSDLPVLRELLEPGVSALMVEPDVPEPLAAAIGKLAGDPELRMRLALAAQAQLSAFTWESRAAKILQFLQ
jgi:glycosyltransferase involved in cell wall biosynthesis